MDQSRLTLTVRELAEALGVSRATGYELVHQGVVRSVRLGRRIVVPRSAVDELLALNPDSYVADATMRTDG